MLEVRSQKIEAKGSESGTWIDLELSPVGGGAEGGLLALRKIRRKINEFAALRKAFHILVFCLCLFVDTAQAQQDSQAQVDSTVQYDDTAIQYEAFSEDKINDFKADDDFNYYLETAPKKSLWERIKEWLIGLLLKLFGAAYDSGLMSIIFYSIAGLVILYVVLKLMGVDITSVFRSSTKNHVPFEVHEENIHEMDFDALINKATEKKEFRKAIRLVYLYALKKLNDGHHINWKPGKTNHDYLDELRNASLKSPFEELVYLFEYTWYGNFQVERPVFNIAKEHFTKLNTGIGQAA